MIITIDFQESLIDKEMEEYIKQIQKTTGWTKEKIIEIALDIGCKWHIKDNLMIMANGVSNQSI